MTRPEYTYTRPEYTGAFDFKLILANPCHLAISPNVRKHIMAIAVLTVEHTGQRVPLGTLKAAAKGH
jgi:hypothetical protein